jgi:hypothetical protein
MRNFTVTTHLSVLQRAAIAIALVAVSSMPVLVPNPASALPKSCVIRNYYNNAELESQVGMRSSCPGASKWGKVTRFVEVETVDLVPEGPSGPGGGGGLPCEFLDGQDLECRNLPIPRP